MISSEVSKCQRLQFLIENGKKYECKPLNDRKVITQVILYNVNIKKKHLEYSVHNSLVEVRYLYYLLTCFTGVTNTSFSLAATAKKCGIVGIQITRPVSPPSIIFAKYHQYHNKARKISNKRRKQTKENI